MHEGRASMSRFHVKHNQTLLATFNYQNPENYERVFQTVCKWARDYKSAYDINGDVEVYCETLVFSTKDQSAHGDTN